MKITRSKKKKSNKEETQSKKKKSNKEETQSKKSKPDKEETQVKKMKLDAEETQKEKMKLDAEKTQKEKMKLDAEKTQKEKMKLDAEETQKEKMKLDAEETQVKKTKLGTEKVGKLLIELALPAIAAQIINLLYSLVDRMYIGHIKDIGALALTGVGVALPLIMLISAFAALIGYGGAPRAAIFMGKKEHDNAEEVLGNSTAFLLFISAALTILIFIFRDDLLMMFGASGETLQYASNYMKVYICGTVFVQFSLGLNTFISAQGFAKISMKTVMIGAICNIILDPIFIFGFDMGVQGAALATIISQGVSAVWVVKFLTGEKTILRIRRKYLKLEASVVLPTLALGVSPFIMQATESLIAVCFNTSLLKFGGNVAVGAMTILTSVMQFSMLPLQGISQGMQPIASFNFGAGNTGRVKKVFKLTFVSCLSYSMFIWVIAMFLPGVFVSMFTSDAALSDYTLWAIRIYMAVAGIFGIQIACQQTFIAIGNAKVSLFLAVLRKIILLIPLIYILPTFFENKAFAVFLAEPVADFIAVSVTSMMFMKHFKRALEDVEREKVTECIGEQSEYNDIG